MTLRLLLKKVNRKKLKGVFFMKKLLKNRFSWFLVFCFVLTSVFIMGSAEKAYSSSPEITIVYGHEQEIGSAVHDDALFFKKLVEMNSDGRIEVKIYPSSLLGSGQAQLEGILAGTQDITAISTPIMNLVPEARIFDLPFLFTDRNQVSYLEYGPLFKDLQGYFLDKSIVLLGFQENGFRHYAGRKPIYRPQDVVGTKHRVPGGVTRIKVWQNYGVNPTSIPFGELYSALERGVVDSQDNPVINLVVGRFDEVHDYLSLIGYVYNPHFLSMSAMRWKTFPDWAKEILSEAGKLSACVSRYKGIYAEADAIRILEERGMIVITISEEDRKVWVQEGFPLYEEWSKDMDEEWLKKVLEFLERDDILEKIDL